MKFKNDAKPRHWNDAWEILRQFDDKSFVECKEMFDSWLEPKIDVAEYQKFITSYQYVHNLKQKRNDQELNSNQEYEEKRRYVRDILQKDVGSRAFYHKYRAVENMAIPLVIAGLVGQAGSVMLEKLFF